MASKSELEKRVAELEEQLASAPEAVQKVVILDQEVGTLKAEVETLKSLLQDAETRASMESAERVRVSAADAADLEKAREQIKDLFVVRNQAEKCTSSDHVLLDGVHYVVAHRNTVKGLSEDFMKKNVEESLTAVVIHKVGG